MVLPKLYLRLEAVDRDGGEVTPGLDKLGTALAEKAVALDAAAPGVEAEQHDGTGVGIVGEPEGVLREKPVGVVGEVEGAV